MDILNQIIALMNKEEVRFFKLYLAKTNIKGYRKDLMLYDYIRKSGEKYDEEKLFKQLYEKEKDKNAFYRLKNRLMEDINKSLTLQHFDRDDYIHVMHLISISRFYQSRNQQKIAFYFLKRGEKHALEMHSYELLNIIYGEFIRLSNEMVSINPEEYVRKRNENREQLNTLLEIDNILATVNYRIKISQNFSSDDNPIIPLLETIVNEASKNPEIKKNPILRFKIYNAVSQILLQKRDYKTLEEYLLSAYKQFSDEGLFTKSNHNTKLQMLTYIVNALFKNRKYNESLEYAGKLHDAMEEFDKQLFDKYLFFYYNSLVINYSKLDKDKAIHLLEELRENDKVKNHTFYSIFINLNLAVLFFDKKKYDIALKNLTRLFLQDEFKSVDEVLKFKISMAELIIRYELKDMEFLEYKIRQVKKDCTVLLKAKENQKENELLGLLRLMVNESPVFKFSRKLITRLQEFVKTFESSETSDNEIINYSEWLSTKFPFDEKN